MSEIEIMAMRLYKPPMRFSPTMEILAGFDMIVNDIEFCGCRILLAKGKHLSAVLPTVKRRPTDQTHRITIKNAETWSRIVDMAIETYRNMGGKLPQPEKPERQFIPLHDLELSEDEGIPLLRRIEDALDEETEKRGVPCFTEAYSLSTADVKAAADYAADGHDDADNAEGLQRFLGVDPAVSETMERAGL